MTPDDKPQWWVTLDGDLDCLDMYERHYSAYRYADQRARELFVGPGNKLVLRTASADAVFVWRRFTDDCIDPRTGERQQGINCAVFRNEGKHLSSSLIRQADAIADATWTDRRHYTYVNSEKVASANPGYCFLAVGWRRCDPHLYAGGPREGDCWRGMSQRRRRAGRNAGSLQEHRRSDGGSGRSGRCAAHA